MENLLQMVQKHHYIVENKVGAEGGVVLMTCLCGSQNYNLDTPESDCDTFSFILPNFLSFIRGDALKSYEFEVEDGKCCVKDMRLALNLLRKPSPNSIECFVGQYKVYNAVYKEVFDAYFTDDILSLMTHCSYKHMADAICGTIKGMAGRNMSFGKKASHTMRLSCLFYRYMASVLSPYQYLELDPQIYKIAVSMKKNDVKEEEYQKIKEEQYNKLKDFSEAFNYDSVKLLEDLGYKYVNSFQLALTDVYLQEKGYEKQLSET